MTDETVKAQDEGVELAKRMAEEEEGIGRRPTGWSQWLIPTIAVCWSLFQLSIASWLIIDSTFVRSIHLGFALLLVYLNYPLFKKSKFGIDYFSATDRIPLLDVAIAILAAVSALYIALDYDGLITRYGAPIMRDLIMGTCLVVLLLEAARRVIGPALPIIAIVFCCYAFFGPYMPDLIAFKGVSLNRFMGQMTMSTEGIYGIPLDVSATIVFLFVLFGSMLDKAGAGRYFIQLALSLLGGFKGGPAKAAVMGSGLTGLVSGSSIANIVTTGTFTIPLMKKVGYPATKAAAVEVAASTDGQLAPPIMGAAAFIIAEYVNVPYVEVIKAAAVPAFASYAALFYITHIEASKLGLRGMSRAELPAFFKTLISGTHYLVPILMLLYELIVVRHSPELAAFNAIWVMAIIMLLQRPVKAYMAKTPLGPGLQTWRRDISRHWLRVRATWFRGAGHGRRRYHRGCGGPGTGPVDHRHHRHPFRRQYLPDAGHHRRHQPDHRHGAAHHGHLYRHGLADRPGHRGNRRVQRFYRAADVGPPVLFLLRDPGRRYPAGGSGGLCRRGDCQIAAHSHGDSGVHVRYPYSHPAVHVHFQQRPDPAQRQQLAPGNIDFCNGLFRQLRLCFGHPGMVRRQKQNMGIPMLLKRDPVIDAARSDCFAGSVSPTISGTGPISSAWPFSACFT
jgi:hypothetical protein